MKALKSIEEAAGLLGISKWTVRSYIKGGTLGSVRLGRRILVEESELERLVANSKTERGQVKRQQANAPEPISSSRQEKGVDHDHDNA
jgi:excisionase family DNA binding protein